MVLRVMTFNIRGSFYEDGANAWEKRAPLNMEVIQRQQPDLLGFQECDTGNLLTYQQHLSGYHRLLGAKIWPEAREPSSYNAIFWHPERLALLETGSFWLSETPEVPSIAWNAFSPRLATWARFQLAPGRELLHLNTHLDHISAQAREQGALLIVQRLRALQKPQSAVIITGDFNCNPDDPVHQTFFLSGLADAYLATDHQDIEHAVSAVGQPEDAYSNTVHAYGWSKKSSSGAKRRGPMRFDWILYADPAHNLYPLSCEIIRDGQPPVYPSDHYPVMAEFEVS
ncbi:MAG: endonuclease/exonuclease/phosphatase family protein [Ktedonobacteraceae bacterium]